MLGVSTRRFYRVAPSKPLTMHKLLFPCLLAFGLLACDGNANETDEPEVIVEYPNNGVPDEIQASFAADHPNATDVEWDVDDDHYEVEFRLNGDKMELEYDFNGRKIDFED